jgi:uncharacterized protein (DUF488 family)
MKMTPKFDAVTIWTVGHSTLPLQAFEELLRAHGIQAVADVRRFPMSRRHPQFNHDALARSLDEAGVRYLPFQDLGGRRAPRPDTPNTAWRNPSFRGYADYMETEPFLMAMDRLATAASRFRTAVMCAEALWWRCHRALIADFVRASGAQALHIMSDGTALIHPYTAAANLVEGRLSYAGEPTLGL